MIEYKKKMKKNLLEQQIAYLEKQQHLGIDGLPEEKQLDEATRASLERQKQLDEAASFESFDAYIKAMREKQAAAAASQIIVKLQPHQHAEDVQDELIKQLAKIDSELDHIKLTKSELDIIDSKIEDLEPDYIMVTGM